MIIGDPLNYVKLDEYSNKKYFRNFLKKGRCYVSRIGELELEYKNNGRVVYPGEEVEGKVEIKVRGKENLIWKVIKNNKVIETVIGNEIITEQVVNEKEYLRIEATDIEHEIFAVINPIYNSIEKLNLK